MKFKPIEYLELALEAVSVIGLVADYGISKKIERECKNLIDKNSLEYTKRMAMSARQKLKIDPEYKSFRLFDGVLARKTKEPILDILDKLEEKWRKELLSKDYPPLKKEEVTYEGFEIRVIPPPSTKE